MNVNSVGNVLNRIHSIEAKFSVAKQPVTPFSHHLSAAVQGNSQLSPEGGVNSGQVEQMVRSAAIRHGVKPELATAVARAESNFSPTAVSSAGAIGVMQLMPATAKGLGVRNIYDVRENIDGGVRYLKQMLQTFNDEGLAVAAYNAGPEAVRQHRGIPPYAETQGYVKNVFYELAKGK